MVRHDDLELRCERVEQIRPLRQAVGAVQIKEWRAGPATAKIEPGKVTRVVFTPDKTGEFTFSCNIFCGSGHEDMVGRLIVTD